MIKSKDKELDICLIQTQRDVQLAELLSNGSIPTTGVQTDSSHPNALPQYRSQETAELQPPSHLRWEQRSVNGSQHQEETFQVFVPNKQPLQQCQQVSRLYSKLGLGEVGEVNAPKIKHDYTPIQILFSEVPNVGFKYTEVSGCSDLLSLTSAKQS